MEQKVDEETLILSLMMRVMFKTRYTITLKSFTILNRPLTLHRSNIGSMVSMMWLKNKRKVVCAMERDSSTPGNTHHPSIHHSRNGSAEQR